MSGGATISNGKLRHGLKVGAMTVSLRAARYREILGAPGAWLAFSGLTAVSLGSSGRIIALLLVVSSAFNYSVAGLAVGASALGAACAAPIRGRIVDRYGTRRVLPAMAIVHGSAWLLVAIIPRTLGPFLVVALSFAAGAFFPPIYALLRRGLSRTFGESDLQQPAFALIESVEGGASVLGPVIAGVLVVSLSRQYAMIAMVLLSIIGIGLVLGWDRSPGTNVQSARRIERLLGPIVRPDVRHVAYVSIGLGAVFGSVEVCIVAAFTRGHGAVSAGLLLGVMAVGGLAGAILYGTLPDARQGYYRCAFSFAVILSCAIGLALVARSILLAAFLLALVGIFGASIGIETMNLTNSVINDSNRTETFTWMASAQLAGASAGAVAAGGLAAHSVDGAFLLVAAAAVVSALVAVTAAIAARSRESAGPRPESAAVAVASSRSVAVREPLVGVPEDEKGRR